MTGVGYVCAPIWLPFRLQVYIKQYQWLANQLRARELVPDLADNTFVSCADWARAQALVDGLEIKLLAARLQALAEQFCPVVKTFRSG